MGNPFGKIIQNGVEYDVTPYAHKIEMTTNTNETYGNAMTRFYNAVKAAIPNFDNIRHAEFHIIPGSGSTNRSRYFLGESEGHDMLTFFGGRSISITFKVQVVGLSSSGCFVASFALTNNSVVERTSWNSTTTGNGEKFVLYYS